MVDNGMGKHLYIEDLVPLVSAATGISQRQTRRTISAFCAVAGEQLGEGHTLTLRGLGRLHPSRIRSYWRIDLDGKKIPQKAYSKVYFSASKNVQKQLNKHLREGGKRAKEQAGTQWQ